MNFLFGGGSNSERRWDSCKQKANWSRGLDRVRSFRTGHSYLGDDGTKLKYHDVKECSRSENNEWYKLTATTVIMASLKADRYTTWLHDFSDRTTACFSAADVKRPNIASLSLNICLFGTRNDERTAWTCSEIAFYLIIEEKNKWKPLPICLLKVLHFEYRPIIVPELAYYTYLVQLRSPGFQEAYTVFCGHSGLQSAFQ